MNVVEPAPLTGPAAPRLDPDSPLVAAAVALLDRHTADLTDSTCRGCGETYPCSSSVHAALVCRAAGLHPESIGVPEDAVRWELVS